MLLNPEAFIIGFLRAVLVLYFAVAAHRMVRQAFPILASHPSNGFAPVRAVRRCWRTFARASCFSRSVSSDDICRWGRPTARIFGAFFSPNQKTHPPAIRQGPRSTRDVSRRCLPKKGKSNSIGFRSAGRGASGISSSTVFC